MKIKNSRLWSVVVSLVFFVGCSNKTLLCDQLPQDTSIANAGCFMLQVNQVLMVQQLSGKWSLPGGTAEPGERAVCTAIRETYEETGVRVEIKGLLKEFENGFRLYECAPMPGQIINSQDKLEIRQAQWVSPESNEDYAWRFPEQMVLVKQWIEQRAGVSSTPTP